MEKKETINSSKRKLGIVLLVIFTLACVAVVAVFRITHRATPIDESSFPDEALRSYVLDKVDTNGDGQLSVEEAAKLTSMSISGVSDLSGLDSFPNLRTVQDSDEILKSVDLRGCSALQVASFSGATNLESLKLGGNSGLKNLYIRNTSIQSVDLASASDLTILECDTDTKIEKAPTRKAQLVDRYQTETKRADGTTTSLVVKATYNEEGRLAERKLKGSANAKISYEYDDYGRIVKVVVDAADGPYANVWNISYGKNGLDMHAAGENGTHIDKTYDALGREQDLSIQAIGLSGEVNEALHFEYDAIGILTSITVTGSDGNYVTYSTAYNAAGKLIALNSASDSYTFDAGRAISLDRVPAPLTEKHDDETIVRDYETFKTNSRSFSQLSETVSNAEGDVQSRTFGTYAYDDEGLIMHGNISADDGSAKTVFDVECHQGDVTLDADSDFIGAVDFRYLNEPDISVDYWLLDTPEWLLNQELERIVMTQDVTGVATWNSKYYDNDNYFGTTEDYAAEISDLPTGTKWSFVDIDGDDSVELLASPTGDTGGISAVYTLTGEKPTLCREAAEGETLFLSGDGYLVVSDAAGGVHLERFNGATFDAILDADENSNLSAEIKNSYLPMSGVEWES